MEIPQDIIKKIQLLLPHLDERQRRLYLASEAEALGRGAARELGRLFNMHENTITAGKKDLHSEEVLRDKNGKRRERREGGGRKSILEQHPEIVEAINQIVDNHSYGNPENPLRWTTKSLRNIQEELNTQGLQVGYKTVGKILETMGFSRQKNQKNQQVGKASPDRDAQFVYINEKVREQQLHNGPVISVDCKKKELIGNFFNNGSEYCPKKNPIIVLDHDFPLPELGKAVPYGIYDVTCNEGFVEVGISKDTAEFAVNSIRDWWEKMGKKRYPNATSLLITADGGGSNGSRCRLWKAQLQQFANETGLRIDVCHYPPGCSKWNKIEHRLFSFISMNWRGRPLETLAVIVSLIAGTTTKTGLKVTCETDDTIYKTGIKVSDEEMEALNLIRSGFRGDWNYSIAPAASN